MSKQLKDTCFTRVLHSWCLHGFTIKVFIEIYIRGLFIHDYSHGWLFWTLEDLLQGRTVHTGVGRLDPGRPTPGQNCSHWSRSSGPWKTYSRAELFTLESVFWTLEDLLQGRTVHTGVGLLDPGRPTPGQNCSHWSRSSGPWKTYSRAELFTLESVSWTLEDLLQGRTVHTGVGLLDPGRPTPGQNCSHWSRSSGPWKTYSRAELFTLESVFWTLEDLLQGRTAHTGVGLLDPGRPTPGQNCSHWSRSSGPWKTYSRAELLTLESVFWTLEDLLQGRTVHTGVGLLDPGRPTPGQNCSHWSRSSGPWKTYSRAELFTLESVSWTLEDLLQGRTAHTGVGRLDPGRPTPGQNCSHWSRSSGPWKTYSRAELLTLESVVWTLEDLLQGRTAHTGVGLLDPGRPTPGQNCSHWSRSPGPWKTYSRAELLTLESVSWTLEDLLQDRTAVLTLESVSWTLEDLLQDRTAVLTLESIFWTLEFLGTNAL